MKYFTLDIQSSTWLAAALTCLMGLTQVPATEAIICYRCTILPRQYIGEKDQPCSKFDGSSRFYFNCPASTFCMKQIIHYRLANGTTVTAAERKCAPQKDKFQHYNADERKWSKKEVIDTEAYEEGCVKGENRGTPNGPSEYCFCSSDYCNGSAKIANSLQYGSLLVIALILYLGFS